VNRPKDPALRRKLLEGAVQYVMRHGIGGLSLPPLAEEIGTTPRMLIHHFGSKETLVAEVLLVMEESFAAQAAADVDEHRSARATITDLWNQIAAPDREHALRAMFEVWGQALVHPERYKGFLESMTEPWIQLLQRQLEQSGRKPAEAAVLATLAVGAFQGLQLGRLTIGDDRRSKAALRLLVDWIDPPSSRVK
jgi:AcrR family transcriptional regulator